jgi:adenine-specific DNA-methyltransferase
MEDFIKAGFSVVGEEANENKLLAFLKEHYPGVIKDNEINLQELKAAAGLPVDEKVNGYGLNFIGRNVARAKYAQKTNKELRLNTTLSKNIDTTKNLVLKGDNLDCLKILKNHYSGKIKCIYIDPPYNTDSDEFVYPDKFDKEEAEVLGLANLSEDDFARMEFSFKTKKSHNGWLAFMYPRLLLARDLLSKDGVIFISIDDNEQANLKLLCDDVFGEENFVGQWNWFKSATPPNLSKKIKKNIEYILCYQKGWNNDYFKGILKSSKSDDPFTKPQNTLKELSFPVGSINIKSKNNIISKGVYGTDKFPNKLLNDIVVENGKNKNIAVFENKFIWTQTKLNEEISNGTVINLSVNGVLSYKKAEYGEEVPPNLIDESVNVDTTENAGNDLIKLFDNNKVFDYPKPVSLIKYLINFLVNDDDIILDFFAGSGTTGHAVMQLNAEDGGNRKFILCQIDEPIKKDKPAYKFCIDNNLPPVISSITIERLKRAGERLNRDLSDSRDLQDSKKGTEASLDLFNHSNQENPINHSSDNNQTNHSLDIGFKVFDSVEAPKLNVDETTKQISITENETNALSRIYNMIFTVGLDEPTQVPEEVVKDCIYKIGSHYYITNSGKISKDDFSTAIKNGKVFIDGWTASLNGTLQNYKEDVKIVF